MKRDFLIDCKLCCLQRKQLDGSGAPDIYSSPAVWGCCSGLEEGVIPHHPQWQASHQTAGKVTSAQGYVVPTIQAVLLPKVRQIYKMTSKQNWWKEETNISSLKLDFHNAFISIWQLTYANFFFSPAKFSTNKLEIIHLYDVILILPLDLGFV